MLMLLLPIEVGKEFRWARVLDLRGRMKILETTFVLQIL